MAEKEKEYPIAEYPYKGICGKCGNYNEILNKDCLCDLCVMMGVKRIGEIPEIILQFVKPRF